MRPAACRRAGSTGCLPGRPGTSARPARGARRLTAPRRRVRRRRRRERGGGSSLWYRLSQSFDQGVRLPPKGWTVVSPPRSLRPEQGLEQGAVLPVDAGLRRERDPPAAEDVASDLVVPRGRRRRRGPRVQEVVLVPQPGDAPARLRP